LFIENPNGAPIFDSVQYYPSKPPYIPEFPPPGGFQSHVIHVYDEDNARFVPIPPGHVGYYPDQEGGYNQGYSHALALAEGGDGPGRGGGDGHDEEEEGDQQLQESSLSASDFAESREGIEKGRKRKRDRGEQHSDMEQADDKDDKELRKDIVSESGPPQTPRPLSRQSGQFHVSPAHLIGRKQGKRLSSGLWQPQGKGKGKA